jgi:RimJ/RimL family protein N-acetyltransferase
VVPGPWAATHDRHPGAAGALAGEAARQGARRVFLQVEEGNHAARALYARCGFAEVHRYHYRVGPAAVTG